MDIVIGIFVGVLLAIVIYIWLSKKIQKLEKNNIILEGEVRIYQEKITLQQQTKQDFKQIANDILSQDTQKLKTENQELLTPLQNELKQFKERIETISKEQSDDRSALKQEINQLSQANKNTLDGAEKLVNALTYDNKQQGDWGEMVLESILRDSGLKKDQQYHTQQSLKDDEGNILRPDVVVHLPDEKDIIIDAKVSLKDYQKYTQTGDNADLSAHIASIDAHIKNISLKSYENLPSVNTLDFIFVFFPIEASLLVALEKKADLFSNALKKKVALVSPSTLMMSLKTVHHIWQSEKQNKNTEQIARLAGNMYDKLAGFVESLDDLEKQLNNANKSYLTAKNRLSEGNGNVFSIAEKIKSLGVNSKKALKA